MKKQQLQEKLIQNHAVFTDFIRGLSDVLLNHAMPGKWTPIQQMSHIWKSVAPVKLAFSIPKFALGMLFGKANRPSRSYEELVARYNEKLSQGGKTTPRYLPDVTCDRILLQDGLEKKVKILCDKIERFSEEELDEYVLPHPLLGKITLREMIYFTIHHVQHHHAQVNASFRFATVLA